VGACSTVLLVVASVSAAAAVAGDSWLPTLRSSSQLSGSPSVAGILQDSQGNAMKPGTRVVLFAYPRSETLAGLQVGDSFEPVAVAKAVVGGQGRYELRVDRGVDLSRFASDTGLIDFAVTAVRGRDIATSYFSASAADLQGDGAPGKRVDATAIDGGAVLDVVDPTDPRSAVKTEVCGETYVRDLGSQRTIVGQSYTTSTGAWQQLSLSSGASSELGVGISVSGAYGSYSSAGTESKSSSTTVQFPQLSGWYRYYGWFTYGKYSRWCYPVYDPSKKYVYQYVARPVTGGINGADYVSLGTAPAANYCDKMGPGAKYSTDSSKARTFSNGVEIFNVIGINLSSRTGYTASQSLTSKNTSATSKQICGVDARIGDAPGLVRVK
jgi:hypothetical protein